MNNKIIELFRKVICSLSCIVNKTKNEETKKQAQEYLNIYIDKYEKYKNNKELDITNVEEEVDFCSSCYDDVDIFDYAEDVEYGLLEMIEEINKNN